MNARSQLFKEYKDMFKSELDWLNLITSINEIKNQVHELSDRTQQIIINNRDNYWI